MEEELEFALKDVEYYQIQLQEREREQAEMVKEFNHRVTLVHEFWIHKIYNESTRPGKILKRRLQLALYCITISLLHFHMHYYNYYNILFILMVIQQVFQLC